MAIKFFTSIALYIIYITAFALIYTYILSNDFIFTTIKEEKNYLDSVISSESIIEKYTEYMFISNYGNSGRSAYIELRSLSDDKKEMIRSAYLNSNITCKLDLNKLKKLGLYYICSGLKFNNKCVVYINEKTNKSLSIGCILTSTYNYGSATKTEQVFKNGAGNIYESVELFKNIKNPMRGINEGLFLRMFYFSAVTATTLGYGEIVPITNVARLTIVLQSVMGLILIGCIIFWVTNRKEGND